jgi:SAM-dependent methyltransferase
MNTESRPITYTSSPMQVSMTDCWYDIASLEHFWIRRRFDVFQRLAGQLIRPAASVGEVGCGNGLVQREVEDYYGIPVTGFDLNELALQKNVSRQSPVHCYDIHQRAPEFRAHFDVMFLFDVLEHISDEGAFLQSLLYHVTDSGSIVINVPAHQSLYSAYDRAAGHVRRYSIRQLARVAQNNGLKIRCSTYWGLPLLPLLLLRKALLAFKRTEQGIISTGFDPGGRLANNCLGLLSRCEPLPQSLFGTSLMAVLENQA